MREFQPIKWMMLTSVGGGLLMMVLYFFLVMLLFAGSVSGMFVLSIIIALSVIVIGAIWGAVTGSFMKLALHDGHTSLGHVWGYGFGGALLMLVVALAPLLAFALPNRSNLPDFDVIFIVAILMPMIIGFMTEITLSGVYARRVEYLSGRKSKRKNEEITNDTLLEISTQEKQTEREYVEDHTAQQIMRS